MGLGGHIRVPLASRSCSGWRYLRAILALKLPGCVHLGPSVVAAFASAPRTPIRGWVCIVVFHVAVVLHDTSIFSLPRIGVRGV